jgi:DNA-binding PadR family transcriptional regulator
MVVYHTGQQVHARGIHHLASVLRLYLATYGDTLYPILTRQKNAGLLTYRWQESTQGPPRKYYMLTEEGRRQLALLDEAWDLMVEQIRIIRHGERTEDDE